MRYSFHGKVRANGQQVDGFVEAANATEAIDRLADRGIIGVYSVHPEPKPTKNAVRLAGEPEPEENEPRQLPRPQRMPAVVPKRIASRPQPAPQPPAPVAAAPAPAPVTPVISSATETALLAMMEKMTALMARVEHALSRPVSVIHQGGPVRATSGFTPAKRSGRIPQDVQSNTLHDIFQNNLDLRKSLDKLASTVNPPVMKVAAEPPTGAADSGSAEAVSGQDSSVQHEMPLLASEPPAARETVRETPRLDSAKPDSARPDSAKPDSARPDAARPDSQRPEPVKPTREPLPNGQKLKVQAGVS